MKYNNPFSDYEPIKRSNSSKPFGPALEDEGRSEFVRQRSESSPGKAEDSRQPTSFERQANSDEPHECEPKSGQEKVVGHSLVTSQESWTLKRGHAITFVGIFLFTTLVYVRPYELFPSLFWLSSSAFWVAIATLVVYVPIQLDLDGKITARTTEVKLVLLLILAGLLSIPLALEPSRAFNSFADFLKVVLIFIVMVNVVRTEKRLRSLWVLVLVATCVLSVAAITDYQVGRLALRGERIRGIIGGLFENPNDLALHLVTMIPIALALMFGTGNLLKKLVYAACAVLIIGGVVATFSRGGFLGMVVSAAVLLWKLAPRSRLVVGSVGAIALVMFILLSPGGYGGRLSTTSDDSAMARFDDLKRSLFIAARHPLVGVGMDNYILYSNSNKATHNAYTQVASEMGVVALGVYIMFIVTPFTRLRRIEQQSRQVHRKPRAYYYSIALQASLAGYLVTSFFASVAYLWYIYYIVAYAICVRRLYENDKSTQASTLSIPVAASGTLGMTRGAEVS